MSMLLTACGFDFTNAGLIWYGSSGFVEVQGDIRLGRDRQGIIKAHELDIVEDVFCWVSLASLYTKYSLTNSLVLLPERKEVSL